MRDNQQGYTRVCALLIYFVGVCISATSDLRVTIPASGLPYGVSFDAIPGSYYDVEASTNLLSWELLRTIRAQTSEMTWHDSNVSLSVRYYRVADLSGLIVVEGQVSTADGRGVPDHCPFCDVLVSSSLDTSIAFTDLDGRYVLRTRAAAVATNVPFTLSFSKIGFRPLHVTVTNPAFQRLDIMSLAGASNNDFTNRLVVSGSETNRDDNTIADIEYGEPGLEPSLWYSFTAPQNGTLKFVVDTTEFLPEIAIFKGSSVAALELVERGNGSNYIEWRIEVTRELTVFQGEQLQIRVGANEHPTRGISGGIFEWRALFEPNFPLALQAWDTNHGMVTVTPPPDAACRFLPGTTVTLTALPETNYIFAGWGGSATSAAPILTLVMNEAKLIAPTFQLANGNYSNATKLVKMFPAGEAWVPLDGSVWYEWTAPRSMPIAVAFDTTNFLHGSIYRVEPEGLVGVGNNFYYASDHLDARFWAEEGRTYKLGVNFEANESGHFRFHMYEPIVARGTIMAPIARFNAYVLPSFTTNATFVSGFWNNFEIWSRVPAIAENFPAGVSINARWFRPNGGLIYSNEQNSTYTLTWAGPSNNDFSNAVSIAGVAGDVRGSFVGADIESGEPGHYPSIWYRLDAPEDGTYLITNNLNRTFEVDAWAGTKVEELQPVSGVVIDQTAYNWVTEWTAREGETTYLRLGGATMVGGTAYFQYQFLPGFPLYITIPQAMSGSASATPETASGRYASGESVTLSAIAQPGYRFARWEGSLQSTQNPVSINMDRLKSVQAVFEIPNDDFDAPVLLAGLPTTVSGVNLHGTAEPDEPSHIGWPATASAWYRWIAEETGDVTLDFDFVDVTIVAAVYTGQSLATLVPVANNFAGRDVRRLGFKAIAGTVYHIAIDADRGHGGPFSFSIQRVEEARYILRLDPSFGGYVERLPQPDGNSEYATGSDVTLRAIPLNSHTFVRWEELTWGDAVTLGSSNSLSVYLDRHRIIRPVFEPVEPTRLNDHFRDREILIADGTAAVATNVIATAELGEPTHAQNASGRSLWWSWTAPTTAPIAFTTFGSDFTNVLAVYTGSVVTSLVRVATGSTGLESRTAFIGDAGVTYHIAVDAIAGAAGVVRIQAIENEQFMVNIASPAAGQSWAEPATVPVIVQAIDSELGITEVNLFTNGVLAFSSSDATPQFHLTNAAPGVLVLSATAKDSRGRTAVAKPVTNYVQAYHFVTNQYFASEGGGVARITIVRQPPHNVRTTVYLDMWAGTAVPGVNYVSCRGAVLFYPGENSLTVSVPLVIDPEIEPAKSFTVAMRSMAGTPITDSALVTISDDVAAQSETWIDDAFPPGVTTQGNFSWITSNPAPLSGVLARASSGGHEYRASTAEGELNFVSADLLSHDVYLDPQDPPEAISLRWRYGQFYGGVVHWGDRAQAPSWEVWMGPLPEPGQWTQLLVPGGFVGNVKIQAMTWGVSGGRAVWDRTEVRTFR